MGLGDCGEEISSASRKSRLSPGFVFQYSFIFTCKLFAQLRDSFAKKEMK